jgi:hypothetical protein
LAAKSLAGDPYIGAFLTALLDMTVDLMKDMAAAANDTVLFTPYI